MSDSLGNKKQTLIVDEMKNAILSGVLPAGTELKQAELAKTLGVSRMPVREVLIILEYMGLVKRLPNNHVQVSDLTPETFAEIFRLCADTEYRILESKDAGTAAAILRDLRSPKPSRNSDFPPASPELLIHQRIGRCTDNAFLQKTLQTMTETYLACAVSRPGHDPEEGLRILTRALSSSGPARKEQLRTYFGRLADETASL